MQPDLPTSARRVLIADNDAHVAMILSAFLSRAGCHVAVVQNGVEAAERLTESPFDLFVCDIDMPVLTGDALLDRLRDDPKLPPTIVISGFLDERTQDRLQGHPRVQEVLRKPFDVAALAERVSSAAIGTKPKTEHQKGAGSA